MLNWDQLLLRVKHINCLNLNLSEFDRNDCELISY